MGGIRPLLLVVLILLVAAAPGRAHELLLPEWRYEPVENAGLVKRGAGVGAAFTYGLVNDTFSDTWSITKSPLGWRWKGWLTAATVGGITTGLIYGVDQRVRSAARGSEGFEAFGEGIRWLGNGPGLVALTGSFALTGWIFDRPKERETAYLLLEASASGYLFTISGKYLMGRARPNKNRGPFYFSPFSGNLSMPSGEATSAFVMAGVITSQYPEWYWQILAYSAAAAVGAGRIALDGHWTSDVFLSAALGIGVSKAVVYFNRQRKAERAKLEGMGLREKARRKRRRHFVQVSTRGFRWTYLF